MGWQGFVLLFACYGYLILAKMNSPSINVNKMSESVAENSLESLPLNVSVITWNLAEKVPSSSSSHQFLAQYRTSDIIVLGVQECENVKPRRHEGHRSKGWKAIQLSYFPSKRFHCFAQHKMGGLQISVFIKRSLKKKVQGIQLLDVACGVGNVVANKGAVCCLLRIHSKTIAFVNAHLAAHQNKVKERNADVERISDSIISRAQKRWLHKGFKRRKSSFSSSNSVVSSQKPSSLQSFLSSQPILNNMMSTLSGLEVGGNSKTKKTGKERRMVSSKGRRKRNRTNSFTKEKNKRRKRRDGSSGVKKNSDNHREEEEELRWPFDAVVFFGDLNYRLELPRLEVPFSCFYLI